MAVVESITLGFIYCTWLNIFGIILLPFFIPEAAARCGCESNRVLAHGFYTPSFNNIPVAGDYQAQAQDIHSNSNNAGQRHVLPNYRILQFQPTYLDFQLQSVGMPAMQTVSIFNPSSDSSLQVNSISRTSEHFHTSILHSKTLLPLTNTTFEVVFLARVTGNVENTIYVNTNKGNFPFQVFGTGVSNPYRLRSFIGARIPIESIFSPYINIYNPFGSNLQVTEIYSSGGELHLELPSGHSTDATQKIWEIPPYETKPVMKVTFQGKEVGNYSGFVRVKAGKPASQGEVVILPFEVEVASARGIYTNIDLLDFGTLRTMDESKSLNLNLMNHGNKSIHINSISVVPPNKAINIHFSPMVLKANRPYKKVASITYTALHSVHRRQNSGKLVIDGSSKSKRKQFKLEVPYRANVLQGTLAYSVTKTAFFAADALFTPKIQPLTITNTFNFSLIIYNASLPKEVSHIFSIVNFTQPTLVKPGKLVSPLSLRFQSNHSELVLSTILRLYTNASIFTIPVHSYNGKLKYAVDGPDHDVLDYGTVGVRENRTITFKIINSNPVEVSIKEYSCNSNIELVRLRLVHIRQGRKSKSSKKSKWVRQRNSTIAHNSTSMLKEQMQGYEIKSNLLKTGFNMAAFPLKITLRPREEATFSVDLTAPNKEGVFQGEVTFKTPYEELHIPMYLKTVVGSLLSRPRRISFDNTFPGQTKSHTLYFESTFHHPLLITDLKLHPPDSRFLFAWPSEGIPELQPHVETKIGWIRFDPVLGTDSQCYLCLCQLDPGCQEWIKSLSLPGDTWELDLRLLEKLKSKWQAVKESQETRINTSIVVNSEIIKGYNIPVHASLTWPAIVEQSIRFPPTHVGNYTIQELVLNNPADVPVLVQVMPLLEYPHPQGALDLVSDRLEVDSFSIELNGHSSFFLPDLNSNEKDHSIIQSTFGVTPAALTLLLKQRAKTVVNIGFLPDDEKLKTSIMVVRNNLTVLDLVVVQGEGARGRFNINGKSPGTNSVLQFELKASHLADCNKSTAKARTFPSFTVKKTFTASNTGQLPVHVLSMNINGYECDGYGFRILNCEPFVLHPNTSRKIDVTFTPDFTASRVTRTLNVVTSMDQSLEFTLLATLPHRLLPLCSSAIPRPFWEPYLHMAAAVLMSTVFVVVIFLAYFDAQKYILRCSFGSLGGTIRVRKGYSEVYPPKRFDLNADSILRSNNRTSPPVSKSTDKPVAKLPPLHVHIPAQKRKSNESNSGNSSRSRSSSLCSTNSDSSRKSSLSTPSPEILHEVKIELERKDPVEIENRKPKKKVSVPNGFTNNNEGKIASVINDSQRQGKQKKSEKSSKLFSRHAEEKPKQENPVANVIIQEVSILEDNEERPGGKDQSGKPKRKAKPVQVKKEKEPSKPQQTPVKASDNARQLNNEEENVDHDPSFITVGPKSSQKSRKSTKTDNLIYSYGGSLDKLDEISISGPRPEVRDTTNLQKPSKSEMSKTDRKHGQKRKSSQPTPTSAHGKILYDANGKVIFDTPTSPHAIAAAVVEAALEKSLGSKHKKGKGKLEKASSAGSTPTSPASLSGSSRSSSYSSIVSNDGANGGVWRLGTGGYSPAGSRRGSPSPMHLDGTKQPSGKNSPVNQGRRDSAENESWSSYLRRFAIGIHPSHSSAEKKPPTKPGNHSETSNSMFYYDHLRSLRETKKTMKDDQDSLRKAPGTKPWSSKKKPTMKSNLDPDSAEFIPRSLQSKPSNDVIINSSGEPVWPIGTKSKAIRPPPGLSRTKKIADIWGVDDMVIGSGSAAGYDLDLAKLEKPNGTLFSGFGEQDRYSSLIPQTSADKSSDLFDSPLRSAFDPPTSDSDADPWMKAFPIDNKDTTWSAPGIQPSIWSTDRSASLPPSESQFSRSLLGLDLSLPALSPTTKDKFADGKYSPLDPFSVIWDPSDDSIDVPYEGWSEDIKEE